MIDFNNAPEQRDEPLQPHVVAGDHIAMFQASLADHGLYPDQIVADGEVHRFETGKKGQKDGFYALHPGKISFGLIGDWRTDQEEKWCSVSEATLTPGQYQDLKEKREAIQQKVGEEKKLRQNKAQEEVNEIVKNAGFCPPDHSYLKAKRIKSHGFLFDGKSMIIPMFDGKETTSLQRISEDGKKMFYPGGKIKGCCFYIGTLQDGKPILMAEGVATGATLHEATGLPVAVAFNAGNLPAVARNLKDMCPNHEIIVCADDDWKTEHNPGVTKARAAAEIANGRMIKPEFGPNRKEGDTDFNDLAALEGAQAVVIQLAQVGKKLELPPLTKAKAQLLGRVLSRPKDKEFLLTCWGKGFLPKGVVGVLAATGGTGKTFFLMLMAAMAANGGTVGPLKAVKPLETLIICGEDDEDEVTRRMWDATGGKFPATLSSASVYGQVGPFMELDGNKPTRAAGFHWLEETIKGFPGLELLIFDPKSRFYGLDENNNDHATQWVQCLEYLGHKYDITIIFTAHTSDSNSGTISQQMNRGASALVDGCRWQSGMIRMTEETAAFFGIENREDYVEFGTPKNNYAANQSDSLFFKRTGTGSLVYVDLKTEGGLHEYVYKKIASNPEFRSRREYLKDASFCGEIKDEFPTFVKQVKNKPNEGLYGVFNSLIKAGRLSEQGGYNAMVLTAIK